MLTFLQSLQHLRYDLGRFVVRRELQMGRELWLQLKLDFVMALDD